MDFHANVSNSNFPNLEKFIQHHCWISPVTVPPGHAMPQDGHDWQAGRAVGAKVTRPKRMPASTVEPGLVQLTMGEREAGRSVMRSMTRSLTSK